MSSIKTASVLAFERKLCNSDGLMYAGSWKNKGEETGWMPIKLQHKGVRGTISNRQDGSDSEPLKLNAKIQNPNLQAVDIAALPFDADTLKLVFTLRVLGNLSTPATCNDQKYQIALTAKIGAYLEEQQCSELSLRYAENVASGRFLWRNRIGAEEIEVKVSLLERDVVKNSWSFDAQQFSLRKFSGSADPNIAQLAEAIQKGLIGSKSYVFLKIEAFARLGSGQEVFPSQELVLDDSSKKDEKGKILYAVDEIAAMHSQKIGNAIRTIDTWYPNAEDIGPISVEPYGSVTSRGAAYRQPKDMMDFYSLLDGWIIKDITPSIEQQHFVVACLIRGGVFGKKDKNDKDKDLL